jgi:hypothetical protein
MTFFDEFFKKSRGGLTRFGVMNGTQPGMMGTKSSLDANRTLSKCVCDWGVVVNEMKLTVREGRLIRRWDTRRSGLVGNKGSDDRGK